MKKQSEIRHTRLKYLIIGTALFLVIITFTPLILSPGKTDPRLFSMPYTLWTGILITILLVVLTYLGSRVRDDDKN